jgi:hypothetical protein
VDPILLGANADVGNVTLTVKWNDETKNLFCPDGNGRNIPLIRWEAKLTAGTSLLDTFTFVISELPDKIRVVWGGDEDFPFEVPAVEAAPLRLIVQSKCSTPSFVDGDCDVVTKFGDDEASTTVGINLGAAKTVDDPNAAGDTEGLVTGRTGVFGVIFECVVDGNTFKVRSQCRGGGQETKGAGTARQRNSNKRKRDLNKIDNVDNAELTKSTELAERTQCQPGEQVCFDLSLAVAKNQNDFTLPVGTACPDVEVRTLASSSIRCSENIKACGRGQYRLNCVCVGPDVNTIAVRDVEQDGVSVSVLFKNIPPAYSGLISILRSGACEDTGAITAVPGTTLFLFNFNQMASLVV